MGTIHIAGLGSGSLDALPYGTLRLLQAGYPVLVRTARHPVVDVLRAQGFVLTALDDYYEAGDTFDVVYDAIAERVIEEARLHGTVVYTVPGHPGMAEKSVRILHERARSAGHEIVDGPGQSFLDDLLLRVGVDPVDGLLLLDAADVPDRPLLARTHLVVVQMYNRDLAAEVKVALSAVYGDEHEVVVVRAAGIPGQESLLRMPLFALDRTPGIDHLTTLYVPPLGDPNTMIGAWDELVQIIATLRSPDGCPWDMEQTHESLRRFAIEEAYELAHAIDTGDVENLQEELGDVLLQVVLHSQIAAEDGYFTARDVIRTLCEKLIRRHPHVFGDASVRDVEDVKAMWDQIKSAEVETDSTTRPTVLDRLRRGRPPFVDSLKVQSLAAEVGFEFESLVDVAAKVAEETDEVLRAETTAQRLDEVGDLLFSVVNLARWLSVDPEQALVSANEKFRTRLAFVEEMLASQNITFSDASAQQLDGYWRQVKEISDR